MGIVILAMLQAAAMSAMPNGSATAPSTATARARSSADADTTPSNRLASSSSGRLGSRVGLSLTQQPRTGAGARIGGGIGFVPSERRTVDPRDNWEQRVNSLTLNTGH